MKWWDCANRRGRSWSAPTTVRDLALDYFCECGGDELYLGGTNPLTQELAKSVLLEDIRKQAHGKGGTVSGTLDQGMDDFMKGWLDVGPATPGFDLPIVQFLGSFDYWVSHLSYWPSSEKWLLFRIDNQTDRASGTHFPERYEKQGYRWSLEELVEGDRRWEDVSLSKALEPQYKVISVLKKKTINQTKGSQGGGNFAQVYYWAERELTCPLSDLPWPAYLPFLEIQKWPHGLEPGSHR